MSGPVDLVVEVAFTGYPLNANIVFLDDPSSDTLDAGNFWADAPAPVWTDLSDRVRGVTEWHRGALTADSVYGKSEAGTATVTFDNQDRFLDPLFTTAPAPYSRFGASQAVPKKMIRFSLVRRSTQTTYQQWQGFIDDWQADWNDPGDAWVTVPCTGIIGQLAAVKIAGAAGQPIGFRPVVAAANQTVWAGDLAGARIRRILTFCNLDGYAGNIGAGTITLAGTTLGSDAWSEIQLTADTEIGEVWEGADGTINFRGRRGVLDDTRSATSQARFSDVRGDGSPYEQTPVQSNVAVLRNQVQITTPAGVAHQANDPASQIAPPDGVGIATWERTDLLIADDDDADPYCQWVLGITKDPEISFQQMDMKVISDETGTYIADVLARELGDRVTVAKNPVGGGTIVKDVFVRGVHGRVDEQSPGVAQLTWTFQSATHFVDSAAGTRPGFPTVTSVTPGDSQVAVVWAAGDPGGGGTITFTAAAYVAATGLPTGQTVTTTAPTVTGTISGLTDGVDVFVEVVAVNSFGTSDPSSPSETVRPSASASTVPGAPRIGAATVVATGSVTVGFTAPASDGGQDITSYLLTDTTTARTVTWPASSGSPIPMDNIANPGQSHSFTVSATNRVGTSTASAAVSVVPTLGAGSTPISLRGTSTGSTTSSDTATSFTVANPAQAGDVILLFAASRVFGRPFVAPTGFTAIPATVDTVLGVAQQLWYRVADGTETATFTVSQPNGGRIAAACYVATGVDNSSPFDPAPPATSGVTGRSATVDAGNGPTTTVNGDQVVWFAQVCDAAAATPPPIGVPSNFTAQTTQVNTTDVTHNNVGVVAADVTQSTAGAVGDLAGAVSASKTWGALGVALRLAAAAPNPTAPGAPTAVTAGWADDQGGSAPGDPSLQRLLVGQYGSTAATTADAANWEVITDQPGGYSYGDSGTHDVVAIKAAGAANSLRMFAYINGTHHLAADHLKAWWAAAATKAAADPNSSATVTFPDTSYLWTSNGSHIHTTGTPLASGNYTMYPLDPTWQKFKIAEAQYWMNINVAAGKPAWDGVFVDTLGLFGNLTSISDDFNNPLTATPVDPARGGNYTEANWYTDCGILTEAIFNAIQIGAAGSGLAGAPAGYTPTAASGLLIGNGLGSHFNYLGTGTHDPASALYAQPGYWLMCENLEQITVGNSPTTTNVAGDLQMLIDATTTKGRVIATTFKFDVQVAPATSTATATQVEAANRQAVAIVLLGQAGFASAMLAYEAKVYNDRGPYASMAVGLGDPTAAAVRQDQSGAALATGNVWARAFAAGFVAYNTDTVNPATVTLPAGTWTDLDGNITTLAAAGTVTVAASAAQVWAQPVTTATHTVSVAYTEPASTGGAAISDHTLYCFEGATQIAKVLASTVGDGLANPIVWSSALLVSGHTYTFQVDAVNSAGEGTLSVATSGVKIPTSTIEQAGFDYATTGAS